MGATTRKRSSGGRIYNAIPDTLDFRDRMFQPTLVEVPPKIALDTYRRWDVPILDQGVEGACTGFGLATVVHYLLRRRSAAPDATKVSPRMLYEMAKRYDEWPGEDYDGSSARGAMKGWHRHGICAESLWKYNPKKPDRVLNDRRARDAAKRPLGAYYRVNHKDLVSMHSALAEVGILFATSAVHDGWEKVGRDGIIPIYDRGKILGGHAFAIVAYDARGFWIQNSWADDWGLDGYGHISYDDWLQLANDVWVARLGAPVQLRQPESTAVSISAAAGKSDAYAFCTLRSHIISIGNDGKLRPGGSFGTSESDVAEIFNKKIPETFDRWKKKRILLYAHGGLVTEESAVQRLADYRPRCLAEEVYPISIVWKSDFWTTLTNIIQDGLRRRKPEGLLDSAKDFMLDRLDDALEPIARALSGKAQWDEMKENAMMATQQAKGGVRITLRHIAKLAERYPDLEIHIAGHSAGAVLLAPLVQMLTGERTINAGPMAAKSGLGLPIETCTLWAPACTIDLFKVAYLPAIRSRMLKRFALFTLTDRAEQDDDCAGIYHKSLLYLVSNAFETRPRIPFYRDGIALLGMEKFVRADRDLVKLFSTQRADWVKAPNAEPEGSENASTARTHGSFDSDRPTVQALLARIIGSESADDGSLVIHRSASSLKNRRMQLQGGLLRP